MMASLRQLVRRVRCAEPLRVLAVLVCTTLLTLAGPATTALTRTVEIFEREGQPAGTITELIEHATPLRTCERTHIYRMRREHHAPKGSCAAASESRGAGFSRHWSPRALDDAYRLHNGFGGPMLT